MERQDGVILALPPQDPGGPAADSNVTTYQ